MATLAVLSPGEMGSRVGAVLAQGGARVLTCLEGRGQASAQRAAAAGMQPLPGLDAVVREAALVLSIVPPAAAEPLAQRIAAAVQRVGSHPYYVDANSIAPGTADRVRASVEAAGATYVDGSIIGAAAGVPERTELLLSGLRAAEVAALLPGLRTVVLGDNPSGASAFKVLYAGFTKGLAALGVELLAGAEAWGIRTELLAAYQQHYPDMARFLARTLPNLPDRADRRAQEMDELAEALHATGLTSHVPTAAGHVLRAIAAHRATRPPDAETLDAFLAWWGGRPS